MLKNKFYVLLTGVYLTACSSVQPKPSVPSEAPPKSIMGTASFYADSFNGKKTANGEIYNPEALTAAHRHYPFGTEVRVTNVRNGKSLVVRINDRGPFIKGRIIDLSRRAARYLGLLRAGVGRVKISPLH